MIIKEIVAVFYDIFFIVDCISIIWSQAKDLIVNNRLHNLTLILTACEPKDVHFILNENKSGMHG
jgi:hypothetical protein